MLMCHKASVAKVFELPVKVQFTCSAKSDIDWWVRKRKTAMYSSKKLGLEIREAQEVTSSFAHLFPVLPIARTENIY